MLQSGILSFPALHLLVLLLFLPLPPLPYFASFLNILACPCCFFLLELLGISHHHGSDGSQSFLSVPSVSLLLHPNSSASLSSSSTGLSVCQFNVFPFKVNTTKSECIIFPRKPFPIHSVFCAYEQSQALLCLLPGGPFLIPHT